MASTDCAMPPNGETANRSSGIDMLRGLLTIGVIAGHGAELIQPGSFWAWIGTGVRMPLFIGLTGYLFQLERARAEPLPTLFRRYYARLILPWLVASIVHLTLTRRIDWSAPVAIILHPAYHLWFVPVMLTFMAIAAASRLRPATLLAISLLPSIAAMYWFGVGHVTAGHPHWMPDRRFFIYPIFFFYGLWIARRPRDGMRVIAATLLAPIGFLWWCGLHGGTDLAGEVAAELFWCLPLLYLLPLVRRIRRPIAPLAGIGRDSLFYYLWHPLVFGLWITLGLRGGTMLAAVIATMLGLRLVIGRHHAPAAILGLGRRIPPASRAAPGPQASAEAAA